MGGNCMNGYESGEPVWDLVRLTGSVGLNRSLWKGSRMRMVIKSGALPGSLHAEPAGGRFGRWGPGGRVRAVAAAAAVAVAAGTVAALGPAVPAEASGGISYAYAWGQGFSGQ